MRPERMAGMVGMVLCGLLALGGQAAAEGLGVGRGIDHVGMLVRLENFAAAGDVLTRQLGFSATPVLTSPAGVENRLIWFDDLSYLELDAFTQRNPATAPFLDFLANHEGAKFYGTEVVDASRAVAFLDGAGYPNVGPIPASPLTIQSTGQVVGLTPLWTAIILTQRLAVGDLGAAHSLVQGNTGLTLPTFRYRGRERFLIPASLTHGVLIEMVE